MPKLSDLVQYTGLAGQVSMSRLSGIFKGFSGDDTSEVSMNDFVPVSYNIFNRGSNDNIRYLIQKEIDSGQTLDINTITNNSSPVYEDGEFELNFVDAPYIENEMKPNDTGFISEKPNFVWGDTNGLNVTDPSLPFSQNGLSDHRFDFNPKVGRTRVTVDYIDDFSVKSPVTIQTSYDVDVIGIIDLIVSFIGPTETEAGVISNARFSYYVSDLPSDINIDVRLLYRDASSTSPFLPSDTIATDLGNNITNPSVAETTYTAAFQGDSYGSAGDEPFGLLPNEIDVKFICNLSGNIKTTKGGGNFEIEASLIQENISARGPAPGGGGGGGFF